MTIGLQSVDFEYDRGVNAVVIARSLSITIDIGRVVALVGPSGCGKSTLLRLIAGLIHPHRGSVLIEDRPAEVVRREGAIGAVFQTAALLPWRSVYRNVALPLELRGSRVDPALVNAAIERVGLQDWGARLPHELSGGMQQRVALARALVGAPRVLLLDEPFSHLDELLRFELLFHVRSYAKENKGTVVLVTHDVSEAVLAADTVLVLSDRPLTAVLPVEVGLAKPRTLDSADEPEFHKAVARVRSGLRSHKEKV